MDKKNLKKENHKSYLPLFTLILNSAMIVVVVVLILCNIYHVIQLPSKLDVQILNLFFWLVGIIAILFCKKIIPTYFILLYSIFLFFSHFLGSVLGFYWMQFLNIGLWWDKFLHTSFGYLICYVALYVLCRLSKIDSLRPTLVVLIIISFSALSAVLWEIIEFTSDSLLHTIAQGERLPLATGGSVIAVNDTMFDLIVHMSGTTVFVLQYILHSVTKKSFLIGNLKINFSKEK